MQLYAVFQVLFLATLANGTPVVAKKILGGQYAWPLDFGLKFFDHRPLFGTSKTIRGIALAILITALGAPIVGLSPWIGATAATAAMAVDLLSSFAKRRLNFPSSSRATGLDQIPESLFPLLACRDALQLSATDIVAGVAIFLIGEIVVSRLLYKAHLRDQPY